MVCAYLMATEGLSLEAAIASVREKRRVICPNQGFHAQLQLWEQMGCKLDEGNPTYRSGLLSRRGYTSSACPPSQEEQLSEAAATCVRLLESHVLHCKESSFLV